MSFLGFFPTLRGRRMAHEEPLLALEQHGDRATHALRARVRQTPSPDRRVIYRLALAELRKASRIDAGIASVDRSPPAA